MLCDVAMSEAGNEGAFVCSHLTLVITGEISTMDAGYNILGMAGT